MTGATLPHDDLLPRPARGQALGTALSIAVHALLLLALVGVVHWRTHTSDVVSAELWASIPEVAAPAPAPTPAPAPAPPAPQPAPPPRAVAAPATEPPPPKVDIATERAAQRARHEAEVEAARKVKEEQQRKQEQLDKQEQLRKQQQLQQQQRDQAEREARELRERREAAAAQARLEQQRQDNLRRMMSQAGPGSAAAPGPVSQAARSAGPSASYRARLVALIRSNLVFSQDVPGNPTAEVRVTAAAGGTIIASRLVKSSGNAAWDDAVLRAIDKTAKLPRDADGSVPTDLIVTFRPKE